MAEHNDFGKWAEAYAEKFLENKGYRILRKNYRYHNAEIDLIATCGNQIIFFEVKARRSTFFEKPYEAVKSSKIRNIIKAANYFMEDYEGDWEARFDIISITPNKEKDWNLEHIENAFSAMDL